MNKVRALCSGDRIAVIAPASPFDRRMFDRGIAELAALGFEPSFDDAVFERHGYVAGSPERRAAALMAAWQDPQVAGVFAVRGGYGSAQMLPFLEVTAAVEGRKPFVGCSDLTALLIFLTTRCDTVGFHGPMLVNLADGEKGYDRRSLLGAISGRGPLGELCPTDVEVVKPGEATGVLLGGTLTQVLASLATPYAFDPPAGYVLLLDDVAERPYRVDRMLTQLVQTGLLSRASAVVCAEFPGCSDDEGHDALSVVRDVLSSFSGPVLYGFPTGHTAGALYTVPVGVTVTVVTRPLAGLIIDEAAVQ